MKRVLRNQYSLFHWYVDPANENSIPNSYWSKVLYSFDMQHTLTTCCCWSVSSSRSLNRWPCQCWSYPMVNYPHCWSTELIAWVQRHRRICCRSSVVVKCCMFSSLRFLWRADQLCIYIFNCLRRNNATIDENRTEIINDATAYGILMTIVGLIQFAAGIVAVDVFNYTALKQVMRMRVAYFRSLLGQDVSWYDLNKDTNVAVRISE